MSDEIEVWDEHEPPRQFAGRDQAGVVRTYTVVEMETREIAKYQASVHVRFADAQNPDYEGLGEELIAKAVRDEDGKPVSASTIKGWGNKFKERAFALCQEVNGLGRLAVQKSGKGSKEEPDSGGGTE